MLQLKGYFQNFSIGRNVFAREPVCGNPGQFTLPGGRMNPTLLHEDGTFAATLKQFTEESGVSVERLAELHFLDQGYYAPDNSSSRGGRGRGRGPQFYVHFVQVDDVEVLAREANDVLLRAARITSTSSPTEKAAALRALYAETGLNDDAAARYEAVPWGSLLGLLQTSLPFLQEAREEWARLVREGGLLFNTAAEGREAEIESTLADPGACRDWLADGVRAFMSPQDLEGQGG